MLLRAGALVARTPARPGAALARCALRGFPGRALAFSSANGGPSIIHKTAMVAMVEAGEAILIDVRSEAEIAATGALLPQAESIPVESIAEGALVMDDDEFEDEWGFPKPAPSDTVIFSCK